MKKIVQTGLMYHENFNWHNPCDGALIFPAAYSKWVELKSYYDDVNRIRQSFNLLNRSGFIDDLIPLEPRNATREELLYFHSPQYIDKLKTLSDAEGGEVGPFAYVGKGSYDIISLAVGGDLAALDAVMEGKVTNAFCLQRPPGAHAEKDHGYGFCIVNNFNIMANYAQKKYGLKRIMIIDWDCHYKNGIHEAWYNDPEVLYIETHQTGTFGRNSSHDKDAENVGEGDGRGYNIPIPMPAGTGDLGHIKAFEEIIVPIADQYKPELVIVVAGFAANIFDPLGGQQITATGYKKLTEIVKGIADRNCEGRLVAVMEGGAGSYMPFCVSKVLEGLSGKKSVVEDLITVDCGFGGFINPNTANAVSIDQANQIEKVKRVQSEFWKL
ncbi:hypothetical protein KPL49_14630 [Clostridium estertheticum]|nr:hypothetical protein [Clostridium estertheticum]